MKRARSRSDNILPGSGVTGNLRTFIARGGHDSRRGTYTPGSHEMRENKTTLGLTINLSKYL